MPGNRISGKGLELNSIGYNKLDPALQSQIGGAPSGTPNRVAFFDGLGILTTVNDWAIYGPIRNITVGISNLVKTTGNMAVNGAAFAAGYSCNAYGFASFTSGYTCGAYGAASFAQGGQGGNAYADYSHKEGGNNITIGNASHAEGGSTQTGGFLSHAEGSGTITGPVSYPGAVTIIASNSFTVAGDQTATFTYGKALTFYQFSGGTGDDLFWTTASVSSSFFSLGVTTVVIAGSFSDRTAVSGLIIGSEGVASHAEGVGSNTRGNYSHAEGEQTKTYPSAVASHAEGYGTETHGPNSHAEGNGTRAYGPYGHAEGQSTIAGPYANAKGLSTKAMARGSQAAGELTSAGIIHNAGISGVTLTISGDVTPFYAMSDQIEFFDMGGGILNTMFYRPDTIATVPVFAAGSTTFDVYSSSGDRTASKICNSTRYGFASVEGKGTVSYLPYQKVVGTYNDTADGRDQFIVGNGISIYATSTAFSVRSDGTTFHKYGMVIKGGSQANKKIGLATLVGGTLAVANTLITANAHVFLTVRTPGGTRGFLSVAINAGVGFTINSTSATETSTVSYMIVEEEL